MSEADGNHTDFRQTHVGPLRIIIIALVLIAIYYTIFKMTDIDAIIAVLTASSWIWIGIAIAATLLSYIVGGTVQYISGNFVGRLSRLIMIGLAGSFLNHFLPLSIGTVGLTAEYYHRLGHPRTQAVLMATVPIMIGSATIILIALILSPSIVIQLTDDVRSRMSMFPLFLGLSSFILVVGVLVVRYKQKIIKSIVQATEYLRDVKKTRLIILIALVSAAQTLVSACVLMACAYAINADINFVAAIVLLIITVLVSEGMPIPGGLGATDVVLIFGLTNTGLGPVQSVAVTLLFKCITFILPVIPGGIALARIDRIMPHK